VKDTPEITRSLVHVRAGGRRDLLARLVKLEADSIVIGSPGSETQTYHPGLADPIEIGLITSDGVVWYSGVVAAIEPGAEPCLHVKLGGSHFGAERRAHPRAPDSLSVDLTTPGSSEPVSGRLIDVSAGGVRLEAPLELKVGDIVGMTVHAPGMNPIQATARVVHLHTQSKSGLQFELAVAHDRERLVRRAFERLALVGWRNETPAAG
jgi:PilZ domain